jgi:hypothetical protein
MPRRKPIKQPSPEFVQEITACLGRVIIAASQIEHGVGMIIADLLKANRMQHRSFIIPTSLSNKVSLLRQLSKEYLSPAHLKTVKATLSEITECAELRNGLVHGFYGAKDGAFAIVTFSGEGRFSGQPVEWSPSDLRKLLARMIEAKRASDQIQGLFPKPLKLPKNRKATAPIV